MTFRALPRARTRFTPGISPHAISNPICQGVDDKSDSQKLIYLTPILSGFQPVVSYTPDSAKENQTGADGAGPHIGTAFNF